MLARATAKHLSKIRYTTSSLVGVGGVLPRICCASEEELLFPALPHFSLGDSRVKATNPSCIKVYSRLLARNYMHFEILKINAL